MPELRRRYTAVVMVYALVSLTCGALAPGNTRGSMTVDGRERTYEIHVPASYLGDRTTPLVVVLHGRLGTGHGNVGLTHFDKVSEAHGFLVAYPDGLNRS